jgi:protein phosphatase
MELQIPELSLVLLVGASGSGKSTFAEKYFGQYEIISSDECRGMVSNDFNSKTATNDAFDVLNFIVEKRLKNGLLTVIDATNVQAESRKGLVALARKYHVLPVAIVLQVSQRTCEDRNENRAERNIGKHAIRSQIQQLKSSLRHLKKEGFRKIHILKSEEEIDAVSGIVREKLYNNKKDIRGKFDIIGDVHGCYDELVELLETLNYKIETVVDNGENFGLKISHAEDRKILFVGDLVDRGPNSPAVLKLVMSATKAKIAYCVCGNHDDKLHRKLKGKNVKLSHGLAETVEQLEGETPQFINQLKDFLYSLISHFVFDDGKLVIAHAGIKSEMIGRGSGTIRSFCMYGDTSGETDEFGRNIRYNWATDYRGKAKIIYGHTPVPVAHWYNNTLNIDTGCVFGGQLTALRYPEMQQVSVDAKAVYCESKEPLETIVGNGLFDIDGADDMLKIEDVIGKRILQTRLRNNITIKEEHSIAALEIMSRFAINPKWLIYLPPTMSPCQTNNLPDFLEHPQQAIDYYKKRGVEKIVCEEKHMGSRAVLVICKDKSVSSKRFGVSAEKIGVCYTRTGRNFFTDEHLETQFLERISAALTKANFWEKHETDWVCLDSELMPWSAKAQSLLQNQYAAVGSSAGNALTEVEKVLRQAVENGVVEAQESLDKFSYKREAIAKYQTAYRNYCWEVNSVEDYKLAPFHILATEGEVHVDKTHEWHMENIKNFCQFDNILMVTPYKIVYTDNEASVNDAINWWLELTKKGGEGMVVKPFDFIHQGEKGLLQPAIKCRGSEYLRIIYGPEYDMPENLKRLKKRGLTKKRSLAIREFAVGLEGLERFIRKEPFSRVHESIFAVLALESEMVDPRL